MLVEVNGFIKPLDAEPGEKRGVYCTLFVFFNRIMAFADHLCKLDLCKAKLRPYLFDV